MTSTIPDQHERENAEEAVISTDDTAAQPQLYDIDTTQAMVRSILSDPESMKAVVHALFVDPDFKKYLATAFVSIYDTFVKMTNNAVKDFETIFEVRLQDGSTGNPHEFNIIWKDEDDLEFFTVDEIGNRVTFKEQNPGVKASALQALKSINAEPNPQTVYIALIVERKVDINFESKDGSIVTADQLKEAIDAAHTSLEA